MMDRDYEVVPGIWPQSKIQLLGMTKQISAK